MYSLLLKKTEVNDKVHVSAALLKRIELPVATT